MGTLGTGDLQHQQTISKEATCEGLGLFGGMPASIRFRPSAPHSGITFVRTDQSPPIRIAAHVDNVTKRARRTALRNGTVAIETVEHCLSACAGLGIDNVEIEVTGDEVPGLDGSSLPFVKALRGAGVVTQDAPRDRYVIPDVVRVVERGAELIALPPLSEDDEHLEVLYELDYGEHGPIGRQLYRVTVTPERFEANIAPARTFVLKEEADQLLAAGFGKHLSPGDIVVFGEDGPIDNTLRFPDECVRHKILDLIGDLMLMGQFVTGRIHARKAGHALNHALVRALIKQRDERAADLLRGRPAAVDVREVQRILPHRYPLLMVDRIIEIEGTERVVGIKNVTINEEYFQGHYPGDPIMPGVLIIEALAQIGGVLLSQKLEHKGKVAVLLRLDKVRFRRPVRPGDQLILEARTIRVRSTMGQVRCIARVGTEVAAEAEIMFALTDAESR